MVGIAVILGAGASFDCADAEVAPVRVDWQPPLVNQLFENRGSFNPVLQQSPQGCGACPADSRPHQGSEAFEDILKQLASAKQESVRRQS